MSGWRKGSPKLNNRNVLTRRTSTFRRQWSKSSGEMWSIFGRSTELGQPTHRNWQP